MSDHEHDQNQPPSAASDAQSQSPGVAKSDAKEKKGVVVGRAKTENGYGLAVWLTKAEHAGRANSPDLTGSLYLDGKKVDVYGFINSNENKVDPQTGEVGSPYLVFTTNTAGRGEPPKREKIATGNAVNHRKDGEPVDFDTILINVNGRDKPLSARVTNACDPELHKRLGFQHERVIRAAPEKAAAAPEAPSKTPPAARSAPKAGRSDPLGDSGAPAPARSKTKSRETPAPVEPTR